MADASLVLRAPFVHTVSTTAAALRPSRFAAGVACFFVASAASVAAAAEPPPRAPTVPSPVEAEARVHAPNLSLWAGTRLGFIGFGGSFFANEPRRNQPSSTESTGNFVGNGVATEIDVGVRLAHQWIPYVFYEHGFMAQGHRFAGSNASSSTDSYGVGLRWGGADRLGFISDLSIGQRVVRVSNGSETFTMKALEVFKLALGAELRVQTACTVEATVSVAGGSMSDSSGDVTYAPAASLDGRTHPVFENGSLSRNAEAYVVLGVGLGIHFDLFGK